MVPAGMHPVGMSFCRYHTVRSSFLPQILGFSPYNEATFAIPDCRTDEGGPAPLLYPRRLYVDNGAAIMAGQAAGVPGPSSSDGREKQRGGDRRDSLSHRPVIARLQR